MKSVKKWICVIFTTFFAFVSVNGVKAERAKAESFYSVESDSKSEDELYKEEKEKNGREDSDKWIFDAAFGVVVFALAVTAGIYGEHKRKNKKD
ncbi:MAG: hypothetical protein IJ506_03640 [Clostridia bacterium]|nr:hypothetical protein [Clostridia bacterium]